MIEVTDGYVTAIDEQLAESAALQRSIKQTLRECEQRDRVCEVSVEEQLAAEGIPMRGADGEPITPSDQALAAVELPGFMQAADVDGGMRRMSLREGTYGGPEFGTDEVYYEDAQTLEDLQDLFTSLPETHTTGSLNLENEQVKRMIEDMQKGHPLTDVQIGKMKELLAKYSSQIAALRASPDKQGQDFGAVPDPATARLVESAGSDGLIDLSQDGVPGPFKRKSTAEILREAQLDAAAFAELEGAA